MVDSALMEGGVGPDWLVGWLDWELGVWLLFLLSVSACPIRTCCEVHFGPKRCEIVPVTVEAWLNRAPEARERGPFARC